MDLVLRRVLEDIGYHITPFGIEGSARIVTEVAGIHDPYYHWTHAHPGLFAPFLEDQNYRFIYQYRDPRDSVVSWAYNEISECNISGDVAKVREKIILSRFGLEEHVARAREWFALGDRVCLLTFEEMKENLPNHFNKILDFAGIRKLVNQNLLGNAIEEISEAKFKARQDAQEIRLRELGLVRKERGVSGAWETAYSPVDKLLFKKVAGDFLIELGYAKDDNW